MPNERPVMADKAYVMCDVCGERFSVWLLNAAIVTALTPYVCIGCGRKS